MKNKITAFLERPLLAITITLIAAFAIGIYVYDNFGNAPDIKLDNINNINDVASNNLQNLTDGQHIDLAFTRSGRISSIQVKAGDSITKGQVLAELESSDVKGSLIQAQANYELAKANYNKILNGATSNDIEIAKTAVNTAQTNLDQIKLQQDTLVKNAYRAFLNSGLAAVPQNTTSSETVPTISGSYLLEKEGQIVISTYNAMNEVYFNASGLVETSGLVSSVTPQAIGDTGLFIKFAGSSNHTTWVINIPNKQATSYVANLNAYQASLTTQAQAIANANALLDQAKAALVLKQSKARPEDIAIAKAQVDSSLGAFQMAQTAYNNSFVYAPADGLVTAISVYAGEVAAANQKAVSMVVKINK